MAVPAAPRIGRSPSQRRRTTITLSPHVANRLDVLRRAGVPEGADPRQLGPTVAEAICFAAAWAESHPGVTPDVAVKEWRKGPASPRTPGR